MFIVLRVESSRNNDGTDSTTDIREAAQTPTLLSRLFGHAW